MPAYASADMGGFYHYGPFHVQPSGDVQFAIQPVLTSIAVSGPRHLVASGATAALSATRTTPTSDDLPGSYPSRTRPPTSGARPVLTSPGWIESPAWSPGGIPAPRRSQRAVAA